MANKNPPKTTERIPNNLKNIRAEIGIKQEELAKILNVSERTMRGYESNSDSDFINLPIDKAICISQTYGYSLDYIYCCQNREFAYQNAFKYDIRLFITSDENNVYFSMPLKYWDYIHEIMKINSSDKTKEMKAIEITKKSRDYIDYEENDIAFRVSIPKEEFYSYVQFDNGLISFSEPNSNKNKHKQTKEQTENILKFFEDIQK